MNSYEQKQQDRRERLERAAARAERLSQQMQKSADSMASVIPFGQPILVGHHSEHRDRRYRERIHNKMFRSVQLSKQAQRLREMAASVGSGGISSDDPEAVGKLRERVTELEARQALMKAVNSAHARYVKDPASLDRETFSEEIKAKIRTYTPRYSWEPHPFAPFQLTNNNANIRRIRERIASLEKSATREDRERQVGQVTIREDTTENRVLLIFPGKPAEEIRSLLKSSGFRWSPSRGAWSRMLNSAGIASADYVAQAIAKRA